MSDTTTPTTPTTVDLSHFTTTLQIGASYAHTPPPARGGFWEAVPHCPADRTWVAEFPHPIHNALRDLLRTAAQRWSGDARDALHAVAVLATAWPDDGQIRLACECRDCDRPIAVLPRHLQAPRDAHPDRAIDDDGDASWICLACAPDLSTCERCHIRATSTAEVGGEDWCCGCERDASFTCAHCDDRCPDDDVTHVHDDAVCPSCIDRHYVSCDRCAELCGRGDTNRVGGGRWCEACTEYSASWCDECETYSPEGECSECQSGRERIHPYHRIPGSPRLIRMGGPPTGTPWSPVSRIPTDRTLYIGWEWEIEAADPATRQDAAEHARTALGDMLWGVCGDSSLNSGVEGVTHAADLASWQAWAASSPTTQKRGLKAHDTSTCGLHVHLSRAALTPRQIWRMVELLGDPGSEAAWSAIFRRRPAGLYQSVVASGVADRSPRRKVKAPARDYCVINTAPGETVEIRWARGTMKRDTILATIEICAAIAHYCGEATTDPRAGLSAAAFLAWIRRYQNARPTTRRAAWESPDYSAAIAYLADRGI